MRSSQEAKSPVFDVLRCPVCGHVYNPTERGEQLKRNVCMFDAAPLERISVVDSDQVVKLATAAADVVTAATRPSEHGSMHDLSAALPALEEAVREAADLRG